MSIAQMRKLRLQKRRGLAQGRRLSQTAGALQLLLPAGQRRWQLLPKPASGGQALSQCLAVSPQAQSSPGWVPRDPLKPLSKVGWFLGALLGAQTRPFSALTPGAGWDQVAHPVGVQLCSQLPVSGVCTAPACVPPHPEDGLLPFGISVVH